jgi:2-polyprenyl-3-methyl-5-hydroxy-6-metoxy-1,4-benzoquinol methylase
MTRRQLRPFWSDEELPTIYPAMYDHTRWDDHKVRVARTVEIVTDWWDQSAWYDGIDLTCGDGAILRALQANGVVLKAYYGDLVFADHLDIIGKVENTMPSETYPMDSDRRWDLYICSETLEHVRDPDELLRMSRKLAHHAVFSTPIDETDAHANPEHYWSWSVEDIHAMLVAAGWTPEVHKVLPLPYYNFQIWCCS